MPQNTISIQAHLGIDETMSFKLVSLNLNWSKLWPGISPTFDTANDQGGRKNNL